MNSSAKTTVSSFLAAAALGAAVFGGCTVSSGTVDDTDGGTQNNNNNKPDGSTSTTDDSGTGSTATCESKQKAEYIISKECQACLNTSCCGQLKTCFDIPADGDAGTVDCNDYATCIEQLSDECNSKPTQEQVDQCFAPCDSTAATGVQQAYEAITSCATTNCAAECGGETPDGG